MSKTGPILLFAIGIFFTGCASHPVVHPGQLRKNEKVYGYALTAENIKLALINQVDRLTALDVDELVNRRYNRLMNYGLTA